jgi:NAD(P)-dependent dehydrogenase (short-subunit alcohol dehydrogenase family)
MTINRRQFVLAVATTSAVGGLSACSGEENVVIDTGLPLSPFGAASTAEEVTLGMDLSGNTALVTGCNSGIGYETMRVLALRGAHVFGTGRNLEKAQKACASVEGNTTPLALELSDFESCVRCADQLKGLTDSLDILIPNAGIGMMTDFELVNGIEKIWAVNYLGHVVLTMNLLPALESASGGRIVHVGSAASYTIAPEGGIDFDNLRGEGKFSGFEAYGRSKLANALFSLKLSRMLDPTSTTSNVIHPGLVETNIGRNAKGLLGFAYKSITSLAPSKNLAEGAATQVYVATSALLAGVSGAYFEDCNPVKITGPNHVFDEALAAQLWSVTENMVGNYI